MWSSARRKTPPRSHFTVLLSSAQLPSSELFEEDAAISLTQRTSSQSSFDIMFSVSGRGVVAASGSGRCRNTQAFIPSLACDPAPGGGRTSSSIPRAHGAPLLCGSSSSVKVPCRSYRSFVRVRAPDGKGSARIPLGLSVYGQITSRGERPYQEDTSSVSCVEIPVEQLRKSLQHGGKISTEAERRWQWEDQDSTTDVALAGQVNWWAVYDGHGGDYASKYLAKYLHQIFEKVEPDMVTDTVQHTREHGGYFRRFMGGALERWVRKDDLKPVRGGRGGKAPVKSPKAIEKEMDEQRKQQGPSTATSARASGSSPAVKAQVDSSPKTGTGSSALHQKSATPDWEDNGLTNKIAPPEGMEQEFLTLSERATLAFLVADRHILTRHPQPNEAKANAKPERPRGIQTRESLARAQAEDSGELKAQGGSTASVLTLHSLDAPPTVWYDSHLLMLGAWHVGDTRILLCPTADGKAIPLTTLHHPDALSESERLRRLGAGVVTDSFGEARWMGTLANTRALGDGEFKAAGVTAEPELLSQVIRSDNYSHITLFSDGISSVMSDQEVLDLARGCAHPQDAAKKILNFAEELGVDDNATVLVVPLKGWGNIGGADSTLKQREFRKSKVDLFRDKRQ